MEDIKIREATEGDREELLPLIRDFWNENRYSAGYEANRTLENAEEEFNKYMNKEEAGIFLAEDDNRIVGFRSWEIQDGFYFSRELFVIPELRRKGVARKLIHHFEIWLQEKNQDKACVWVTPRNEAMIELARSEGYDVLNMIELCKPFEWSIEDPPGEAEALGRKWRIKERKDNALDK